MRVIHTREITLEPLMAVHAADMFVVLSDPAIYEYENAPPASAEALRLRYTRLETRQSTDGREQWLNWVIRLPGGPLIGYVQATVKADHSALIAYELASPFWGRGLAHQAVTAMIGELADRYQTRELWALLKRENHRSMRLLERLGFSLASSEQHIIHGAETDESLMHRTLSRA
jgi:RimJ/RimL family protein N-acetyltransferase